MRLSYKKYAHSGNFYILLLLHPYLLYIIRQLCFDQTPAHIKHQSYNGYVYEEKKIEAQGHEKEQI